MLKLQISGTKNDLIAFQRWMKRAGKIPPYFFIDGDTKLNQEEIHEGAVEIIDHYPGGHVSIDVMSDDTLYKHLSLTDVIEHIGKAGTIK